MTLKNTNEICMVFDKHGKCVDLGNYFIDQNGKKCLVTSNEEAEKYGHLVKCPIYARAKTPKLLKPQDGLTEAQRKALDLPKTAPRKRLPNEATRIEICNASSKTTYRTGQGEAVQPIRTGATRALEIPSRGVRT